MAEFAEELPTLIAQVGPLNGQRWMLKSEIVIGREEDCDVIIPNRQVSRYHARISLTPKGTLLEDLSSKNGTHLNGQVITQPTLLQDGDMLQIALAQQFLFLSSDATLPLDAPLGEQTGAEGQRLLRLDRRSHRVWVGKAELLPPLSVSQFQLLALLYDSQGRVVTRPELIQAVWTDEDAVGVSEQALDALIRRLRDRLASIHPDHAFLVTVRGHGMRFDNPSLAE